MLICLFACSHELPDSHRGGLLCGNWWTKGYFYHQLHAHRHCVCSGPLLPLQGVSLPHFVWEHVPLQMYQEEGSGKEYKSSV